MGAITTMEGAPPLSRKRLGIRVFVGVFGVLLAWGLYDVLRPSAKLAPLPNPNGYDDLTRAGAMVVGRDPRSRDRPQPDADSLRAFVGPNQAALALARAGLARKIRVPVPIGKPLDDQIQASLNGMGQVKQVTRLLACEGLLALEEGRRDDAVRAGLDLVTLGHGASRGGLTVDRMGAQAAIRVGVNLLSRLRSDLPAGDSRKLVRALETLDAHREPIQELFQREDGLVRASSFIMRVNLTFNPAAKKLRSSSEKAVEFSDMQTRAELQLLVAEIALHAYRADHGDAPDRLTDLVPDYLTSVPEDPFSGRPLAYRKLASGPLVYSVGPDGKDDGGSPGASRRTPIGQAKPTSRGDYTLADP